MEGNDKEYQQQGQEGSGSAENVDKGREEQKARHATLNEGEKEDIASQTGLEVKDVIDVQQTGALSGRDDAGGGSSNNMENTSSNQETERF
jgi:hypothetical protein